MKQNYAYSKNIYATDDVPTPQPYTYQPYPKWITLKDGTQIIVKDEAEHFEHEVPNVVAESDEDPTAPFVDKPTTKSWEKAVEARRLKKLARLAATTTSEKVE